MLKCFVFLCPCCSQDADGDYIVDENIGNVPLEEDTDFEDCQSYHSMK